MLMLTSKGHRISQKWCQQWWPVREETLLLGQHSSAKQQIPSSAPHPPKKRCSLGRPRHSNTSKRFVIKWWANFVSQRTIIVALRYHIGTLRGGRSETYIGRSAANGWPNHAPYISCLLPQASNIHVTRTLVGNDILDDSDIVGASPVGAAPTISLSST